MKEYKVYILVAVITLLVFGIIGTIALKMYGDKAIETSQVTVFFADGQSANFLTEEFTEYDDRIEIVTSEHLADDGKRIPSETVVIYKPVKAISYL